mmetsp:Transcript_7363/g.22284  ORF Transcript_7363/g.22284 Transcript_7363/m.22284 type:complete len:235 (-) Transcript_7363:165-869(-)
MPRCWWWRPRAWPACCAASCAAWLRPRRPPRCSSFARTRAAPAWRRRCARSTACQNDSDTAPAPVYISLCLTSVRESVSRTRQYSTWPAHRPRRPHRRPCFLSPAWCSCCWRPPARGAPTAARGAPSSAAACQAPLPRAAPPRAGTLRWRRFGPAAFHGTSPGARRRRAVPPPSPGSARRSPRATRRKRQNLAAGTAPGSWVYPASSRPQRRSAEPRVAGRRPAACRCAARCCT